MPEWLSTMLKIIGGVAIIAGCIIGSVFTAGTLSVVLAGAAVGAIAGGVGAGISTAITGGDINDFGNAFLVGTITGAVSGAVGASSLGVLAQAGINAGLNAFSFAGTQLLNNSDITLGGLAVNSLIGFVSGIIGGNGWLQSSCVRSFVNTGQKAFIRSLTLYVRSSIYRSIYNTFLLIGMVGGSYEVYRSQKLNPKGYLFGW